MKKQGDVKSSIFLAGLTAIIALVTVNLFSGAKNPEKSTVKEDTTAYQPPAYFDLVVYGENLDPDDVLVLLRSNFDYGNKWSKLPWASFETDAQDLFVMRHLATEKFIGNDIRENFMRIFIRNYQRDPAQIKGVYAFPHTSKPTERYGEILKRLIEQKPMEAKAHSLADYVRPTPNVLESDEFDVLKIEAPVRYKKPAMLEIKWLEILYSYGN